MILEDFLTGLLFASTISGFITEGIKKLCEEHGFSYYANAMDGIVSVVVSVLLCGCSLFCSGTAFTAQTAVLVITFVILTWLCSMVGYDKVSQAVDQFKSYGKE